MKRVIDFLGSFGFTLAILAFMFLITLFGTLVQETKMSLYDAQRLYFDSWYVVHELVGPVRLPLPGGVTLMTALAVNLLVGGIIRMRWRINRIGILVTHFGIALLLLAGLVQFAMSYEGLLALHEGERTGEFYDSYDYEIVVFEPLGESEVREHLVPHDEFAALRVGDRLTVRHREWPFVLEVFGWMPNARVRPLEGRAMSALPVVDGHVLREVEPVLSHNQRNLPGCYVTARLGSEAQTGILWEVDDPPRFESAPWTIQVEDEQWGVKLRKKVHQLPFDVRVDDFNVEFYPNTRMAKSYDSHITAFDDRGLEEKHHIWMNNPLRRDDFILFQTNWGPQNEPHAPRMWSVFSVVTNPADKWPEIACWVIGAGLLVHFGWMLIRYTSREAKKREAAA